MPRARPTTRLVLLLCGILLVLCGVSATAGQIAVGIAHTVALKGDGTVWAWERNNPGQPSDTNNRFRQAQAMDAKWEPIIEQTDPQAIRSLRQVQSQEVDHLDTECGFYLNS